jgi:hypothetical protein
LSAEIHQICADDIKAAGAIPIARLANRSRHPRDRGEIAARRLQIPQGALRQRNHPLRTNLTQLLNYLIPIGYRLSDERTEALLPSEAAALEQMIGDGASWNVIARVA